MLSITIPLYNEAPNVGPLYERLHAALASMSPAVLAYRNLAPVRDRLLAWLAGQARS